MRHKVYGKKLSRNIDERNALFKNLVQSLVKSESIQTTEAKAKAVKGLVDKLITAAKSPTTQRLVAQFLVKKEIQEKLFNELVPRLGDRNSGYTSIVKLGKRLGDGTMMVRMSLLLKESRVKSPESRKTEKSKTKKETKSSRP